MKRWRERHQGLLQLRGWVGVVGALFGKPEKVHFPSGKMECKTRLKKENKKKIDFFSSLFTDQCVDGGGWACKV